MNKREMLLMLLAEEAAEIAQAASKCLRFTPEHRKDGEGTPSNLENLQTELNDLNAIIFSLKSEGIILNTNAMSLTKLEKLDKYFDISRQLGTLT